MEFASGGNLHELIKKKKNDNSYLKKKEALELFCQICFAIQHIHEQNILHRDLKTQNIMLDKTHKIAKVGDFGISKLLESRGKACSVVGTPSYLSPELCKGISYDTKSDIWALGCVLYEMLTLHYAFEAENNLALIQKICKGNVAPIPDQFSSAAKEFVGN
ncbi:Serine/threonine-protein kinase Nek8 [Armadillidium vulgare]|nr:Serine/threonine-protein kinase Nek8 [Armadillidium vulgare]